MSTGPAQPHRREPAAPLLRAEGLLGRPGVVHGFTTRHGGVSRGSLAALNLARKDHEHPDRLAENWRIALASLGAELPAASVAVMAQVHGRDVVEVDGGRGPHEAVAEADALVTTRPGVVLAVRTADCVPVLLAAPGAVAVAHAGWRGTVAGVIPAVVQALCRAAGCEASDAWAAIGPHISADAYEVGGEVVAGLRSAGVPDDAFLRAVPNARDHVDLGAAVAWQLQHAGLARVEHTGGCTASDPRFYSHRRDGALTGRQAGLIARVS